MGFFNFRTALKSKLSGASSRFSYAITVHSLSPWPVGNRAIAIGWQRGKERRGATSSVYPSLAAKGTSGTVVRFNEKFDVPATLYKVRARGLRMEKTGIDDSGMAFELGLERVSLEVVTPRVPAPLLLPQSGLSPVAGATVGSFKKKCLILAVLETDGLTQATAALGRVVIDLAEFASPDGQQIRTFHVACSKAVSAALGGEPQLTVTIRCKMKKVRGPRTGSASGSQADDVSNPSTDTTGSRMTANLSSFLRFRHGKAAEPPVNTEQDLHGFDALKLRDAAAAATASQMERIEESEHDDAVGESRGIAGSKGANVSKAANGATVQGIKLVESVPSNKASMFVTPAKATPATSTNTAASGVYEHDGGSYTPEEDGSSSVGPISQVESSTDAHHQPMTHGMSPSSASRMLRGNSTDDQAGRPGPNGRASALQMYGSDGVADASHQLQGELLNVAALEVSVYLSAPSLLLNAANNARATHAPARRLARTMLSLGPEEAATFGSHALRVVSVQARSVAGETGSLALWWTNVVHLRALLLQNTQTPIVGVSVLLGELQSLERSLFDDMLVQVWDHLFLPAVMAAPPTVNGTAKATAPAIKRAVQEAALKRWFDSLELVVDRLVRLGRNGHIALLRQQLMRQCLVRMDALLFYYLLTADDNSSLVGVLDDYDPLCVLWGGSSARGVPKLDDSVLPFSRGCLSFGGGMSVKMSVTRLQQWAASETLMSEVWERGPVTDAGSSCFPMLRGAADLLMMPKEMLLDRSIRQDVCTALSIRSVIFMMSHFSPDEFASGAVSGEVLDALQEEALLGGGGMRAHLTNLSITYRLPTDDTLIKRVETASEPGVEYDADSETELESLAQLAAVPAAVGTPLSRAGSSPLPARFKLLHELWASGAVPRAKRSSLQAGR